MKARIHTKGTVIIKRTNEHLHDADKTHVRNLEVKVEIKRRAIESNDPIHHIVGDELEDAATETVIKLPKIDSIKRTFRRERQIINALPAQPECLEELIIPPEYAFTAKGENFLLYDSRVDPQRFIIFGIEANVEMLNTSQIWLCDGTFKTAPKLFSQVYCIHGLRVDQSFWKMDIF